MVPAMIEGVNDLSKERGWQNIETKVMKSDEATEFPDNYFTHSITNFSIFNFVDRVKASSEIHRTLKPGGQVIITTWKRFAPGVLIHEVQRRIRPDLPLMKLSGPDMFDGSAVFNVLVEGGFVKEKLEIVEGSYVVKGENVPGLIGFMQGPFTAGAREGWSEEEKGKWNIVLDQVVEEELKANGGGILFEMYAVIGLK
jgi:SAM-dependent methyltransferase